MAPKYILHYFQVAGRGEFIRLIFKHADVDYSEKTLLYPQDLPKTKENGMDYKFTIVYICFQMRHYKLVIDYKWPDFFEIPNSFLNLLKLYMLSS